MAEKTVVVKCKGAGIADITELHEFQSDLKELSVINAAKLRGEILNLGFSDPFSVWIDSKKTKYVLNGHQRLKVLQKMREEGYKIPKLPFTVVEADDWRQAKLKVLALTSQYGEITPEGLGAFMQEAGIKLSEIDERFAFGPEMIEEMQRWLNRQLDPTQSPWAWKNVQPVQKMLPDEEMTTEFWDWMRGFKTVYALYSGGKDSMALMATLFKNKISKKKIEMIFFSTPLDYPELKESVIAFAKLIKIKLHLLGKEYAQEEYRAMFEKIGFPTGSFPWCTSMWRVRPVRIFVRDNKLANRNDIVICSGFRRAESIRRRDVMARGIGGAGYRAAYPILDMKTSDVYKIIEEKGWPLDPIYIKHDPPGFADRLGCFYCHAQNRKEWMALRQMRPDIWARAVDVVALGCASPNMSDQEVRDMLRKLCGYDTVYQARKRMGLPMPPTKGTRWTEPAHDPDEDPIMPSEEITKEDFGEGKLFTNR